MIPKCKKIAEYDDIYYKTGDTYSSDYGIYLGGTLTGAAKQVAFSINTPKSMEKIKKAILNSMEITFRSVDGTYLLQNFQMSNFEGTVTIERRNENVLSIYWVADTAFQTTNNIPVAVCINKFNISFL